MEYLEERYPEPALLPPTRRRARSSACASIRFDDRLGDDYYAFRRGDENASRERLAGVRSAAVRACGDRVPPVDHPRARHARRRASRPTSPSGSAARDAAGRARGARRRRRAVNDRADELAERLGDPELTVLDVAPRPSTTGRAAAGAIRGRVTFPARATSTSAQLARARRRSRCASSSACRRAPRSWRTATAARARRSRCRSCRAAGYDARNYVGSWHEWSRRDELPIET